MYGKFEFAKIRDVQLKLNFVWSSSNVLLKLVIREFVSRDGLPRGVLPSGILKIEKYCPGLKVRSPRIWAFPVIENATDQKL